MTFLRNKMLASQPCRTLIQWLGLLTGVERVRKTTRISEWATVLTVISLLFLGAMMFWIQSPISIQAQAQYESESSSQVGFEQSLTARVETNWQSLRGSQLFSMNTKKPRAKRPVKNVTLLELSKNLEIQAIVGGAVPRVYLLDRRTQQTHNVAVGMVIGDIEIREIRDHGVTLGWKKETLELSM